MRKAVLEVRIYKTRLYICWSLKKQFEIHTHLRPTSQPNNAANWLCPHVRFIGKK